jgi:beta-lactamase regulating signal transducer with metallopeptidase domain
MVEEWNSSIIYENYFNECEPIECTYNQQTKNSIIYIVTTIIGLNGGLITVLKLIVPRLVKFARRKKETAASETGKI